MSLGLISISLAGCCLPLKKLNLQKTDVTNVPSSAIKNTQIQGLS